MIKFFSLKEFCSVTPKSREMETQTQKTRLRNIIDIYLGLNEF